MCLEKTSRKQLLALKENMLNWETKKGFHYWGNTLKCQRSHTCAPQQLLRLTENKNVSYHFLKIS